MRCGSDANFPLAIPVTRSIAYILFAKGKRKRDVPRFLIAKQEDIRCLMHYVYLLISIKDQSWYIGETSDLQRRFSDHNNGLSRYTNQHRPYELVYYEAYTLKKDAKGRERYLKSGPGRNRLKAQMKNYFKT